MIENKSYTETDPTINYDAALFDPYFNSWDKILKVVNANYYICYVDEHNRDKLEKNFGKPTAVLIWNFPIGKTSHSSPFFQTHMYVYIYSNVKLKKAFNGEYNNNLSPQRKGMTCLKVDKHETGQKEEPRNYLPHLQKLIPSVIVDNRPVKKGKSTFEKYDYVPHVILDYLSEGRTDFKVWDGFAGTGSFGKLCKRMGFEYTGYDIDKEKVRVANLEIEELVVLSPRIEKIKLHIRYLLRKYNILISASRKCLSIIKKLEEYIVLENSGEDHRDFQYTSWYQKKIIAFMDKYELWDNKLFIKRNGLKFLLDLKFNKDGNLSKRSKEKVKRKKDEQ